MKILQNHELEELRQLFVKIREDERVIDRAGRDKDHAELCISEASQRIATANARLKELLPEGPTMDVLALLAEHSETYGRTHL